ncbi:MAG TPA: hypothetical protein VK841_19430 [Polyangiaceae bacterium]|jgi:hypothetical protein|nr:hypothetical protein [Polyangiaceae bacterium]
MRNEWLAIFVACGMGPACSGGSQVPASSASAPAESSSASERPETAGAVTSATPAASAPASTPSVGASSSAGRASPPSATGGSVLVGEIAGTPKFDPKPPIEGVKADLLDCFNQARGANPALHGKLTLTIVVNEAGRVNRVDANPGGLGDDASLLACVSDVLKARAQFAKPGGMATVTAPLVFRR